MTTEPRAQVILDSISPQGHRLTTLEVTMHRFVLSEFNTHRVFERNSASSRAIPVTKQLQKIEEDLAYPLEFGSNQAGMQAGDLLEGEDLAKARHIWEKASTAARVFARELHELGVHKQVTNRILEPFMWHTVICTATTWDGFFEQRDSPLAQPEIARPAHLMRKAMEASTPIEVGYGEWHTPYIRPDEIDLDWPTRRQVSAARCARVSYLTHAGVRDLDADLKLYQRLVTEKPPHASPLGHVATPWNPKDPLPLGPLQGWLQLRHIVEAGLM